MTASLWHLGAARIRPVHRAWFAIAATRLERADLSLLAVVVPPHPSIADCLFGAIESTNTSLEHQLQVLAQLPVEVLRHQLGETWQSAPMPAVLRGFLASPRAAEHLADAFGIYWAVAIEPYWTAMRSVLDDDIAHRASLLTEAGVQALFASMNTEVSLQGGVLYLDKRVDDEISLKHGLTLVPSVFVWPKVIFAQPVGDAAGSLTYPARGVGKLWDSQSRDAPNGYLGALLGRSRASILAALDNPLCTLELSLRLGQSSPAVSQHLSVLRQSGLVMSWRSGRRVLYQRTPLGTTIANDINLPD
ncbi:DUF5937 family protein [Streptomyces sp. SID13031]|uniref:ArsR/SmtB family transcription factor n=1 Tax=Streptomyces sp. SID13031 TaxID=2706046 RepID=UPI0013C7EDF7|nr:DUF5937 family protein [Streptomyces sp. SID13031]NEA36590.1 winged helix-turn-helix transcriptional regulator [Streptomyces sp. SID13031]